MGGSGRSRSAIGHKVSCEDIDFSTTINSANSLDSITKGDVLRMVKNSRNEVEFHAGNGTTVGVLFSQQLLKIVNCMAKGFEYSAIVEELRDGVCRVRVFCSKTV
jgi:hypothetical protein